VAVVNELFVAYQNRALPTGGGYVVSSFFDANSTYSRYEVISYGNVKDIYVTEGGLVFQADGLKIFVLVEPANYSSKHTEPAYRDADHRIPYRFSELNVYTSARQDKVCIGKKPVITYTSFTVLRSEGQNYSYIFSRTDDLMPAMEKFFAESLWKEARLPKSDAMKAAKHVAVAFEQILNPADHL
jgi:hypothetical protein